MAPTGDYLPSDEQAATLARLYQRAVDQLEAALGIAIARMALGNVAYRLTRLRLAEAVLARLKREAPAVAVRSISAGYRTGIALAEAEPLAPRPPVGANFGGVVHERAAAQLAQALIAHLDAANGLVGRRFDDVYRRVSIEAVARHQIAGSGLREMAKGIQADLLREGLTGFIDRTGRRWRLDSYASMVAVTLSRQAVTQGFLNRMGDRGIDLVQWSEHPHSCSICAPFQGRTFSISGESSEHPKLTVTPPAHPRCRHVLLPPRVNLEDLERRLGFAA